MNDNEFLTLAALSYSKSPSGTLSPPALPYSAEYELEELRNCTSANYTNFDRTNSWDGDAPEEIHALPDILDGESNSSVSLSNSSLPDPDVVSSPEGQATRSYKVSKPFQTGILRATYEMRRYPSVEVSEQCPLNILTSRTF